MIFLLFAGAVILGPHRRPGVFAVAELAVGSGPRLLAVCRSNRILDDHYAIYGDVPLAMPPDWLIVTGSSLLIGLPPHLGKSWRFASYLGVSWLAVVGSIGPM